MIKRIRKIEGVGTFCNFPNGGRYQFEKLTLIHGLNCYGKSTLCDILNSLATNNPQIIIKRKSIIPGPFKTQNIELTYSKNGDEKNILFQNNGWILNEFDETIEIFDSRFISENIFTGLEISRANKEKITDFILGEENVRLAIELQRLNQNSNILTRNLNENIRTLQGIVPSFDIDKFIKLEVAEDKESIQKSLDDLQLKKQKIKNNIEKSEEILRIAEPKKLELKIDVSGLFITINSLLMKSFEDINRDAANKTLQHIQSNFYNKNGLEEQWIKQGFNYLDLSKLNDSNCPFCGQNLIASLELMKVYQDYFNEEYNNYIQNLETELSKSLNSLKKFYLDINAKLKDNILILKEYISLIDNQKFNEVLKALEILASKIDNYVNDLNAELKSSIEQLEKIIAEKVKRPHLAQNEFDFSSLNSLISSVRSTFDEADRLQSELAKMIDDFKNKFKTESMNNELSSINSDINNFETKMKRIENNVLCEHIISQKNKSIQLKKEIKDKTDELNRNQNIYLKKYFDQINFYFKKFGSNDFRIEKQISTKGNKPVISIIVYFKNKQITENEFSYVFSDSDRRALALSIFWAKLKVKDASEKQKCIVVLDDPVTSFDDNRITNSVNELILLVTEVNQVITFSHYVNFIKRIVETNKTNIPSNLLCIKRLADSSIIEFQDIESFCQSVHEKIFKKIHDFIQNGPENDISKDLRVFLENEIKSRFKKQITELNLINCALKDLVYQLYDNRFIPESNYNRINEFLNTLNPEHHVFTTSNTEDRRAIAEKLINFIYYELSPITVQQTV